MLLAEMTRNTRRDLLVLLLHQLLAVHADRLLGRLGWLLDQTAQLLERVHAILCESGRKRRIERLELKTIRIEDDQN